jgi:hypothetical protein
LGIASVFSYSAILEQKNFNLLRGVALPFSVLVSLRFLLKCMKFGGSDSDFFAANRQFREWFEI